MPANFRGERRRFDWRSASATCARCGGAGRGAICGTAEHVDVLVRQLVAGLAVLEDAENIFSSSFVVPPRQEFGFITSQPAAVAAAK